MSQADLDVLLLAAGLGQRLRPLTEQVPKALLPVCGVPLLDRHLARLLGDEIPTFGAAPPPRIRRVVVNTHHLAEQISAHIERHAHRERIVLSHEPAILGTGGAIAQALPHLRSDPFIVINSDALFDAPLAACLAWHAARSFPATLILVAAPRWASVFVAGDTVREIRRGQRFPDAFTFSGCHVVSQELARALPRHAFHDVIETYAALTGVRRLGAFVVRDPDAPFLDVGTPGDYLAAHRRLMGPEFQHRGFRDPSAMIGPEAWVEESVVLGGARLDPGTHLRRCIIGPGACAGGDLHDLLVTGRGNRAIEAALDEPHG